MLLTDVPINQAKNPKWEVDSYLKVINASLFWCVQVMLLRNHGVVCCGETIEEAWYNTYHTVLACETQVRNVDQLKQHHVTI